MVRVLKNGEYKEIVGVLSSYIKECTKLRIDKVKLNNELENTVNNAYAFIYLHELELIKCFEEQYLK